MSYEGVYDFYIGRINSARSYGLASDDILDVVLRCSLYDSFLTDGEFVNIMKECHKMHEKILEDNYNETWK